MLKRFVWSKAYFAFVAVLMMTVPAGANSLETGSRDFIQAMASDAIHSLTDQNLPKTERIDRFRTLFNEKFAVSSIGKFVLGRYWNRATEDERTEYMKLFEDLMVVSYVDRFSDYAGEALELKGTRPETNSRVTVFSEIKRPGGAKPVSVDWRVGSNGKIYKILDVVVEGTSLSVTLKSDFSSIIRQKGAVKGLIEELRKKTAALNE